MMQVPRQPFASVLLRTSGSFDEPVVIWEMVQSCRTENWERVSDRELRALFNEVRSIGQADLGVRGQPREYRWSLGLTLATLDRAVGNRHDLHLVELTDAVRHLLMTYEWNLRTLGRDPYRGLRSRLLDVFCRLMLEAFERDSLAWVLDGPPPNTPQSTVAQRIQNLRRAKGLSQSELARQVKVVRSTVERWETGKTEPQPPHRERLAQVLGGLPSNYA